MNNIIHLDQYRATRRDDDPKAQRRRVRIANQPTPHAKRRLRPPADVIALGEWAAVIYPANDHSPDAA